MRNRYKYKKPQKRNPRQLTINQHVFPVRSLARFTDSKGRLAVRSNGIAGERLLRPNNAMFCAKRVWDDGAERGFMKSIEDNFQMIADQVVKGRRSLEEVEYVQVTEFYALWQMRAAMRENPSEDAPLNGIALSRQYTADEQEILEKNDLGYIQPDRTISGRFIASFKISQGIMNYKKQLPSRRWGVVLSSEGEFVVPDQFGTIEVVPLAPKVCLVAGLDNCVFSPDQIKELNRAAFAVAKEYCVARTFAACPT
jgi:hypothetical protein